MMANCSRSILSRGPKPWWGSTGLNFVGALDFAAPEPATFLLFKSGLMAMAVFRRRRSQDI
jgi:PEP-CTERM motif